MDPHLRDVMGFVPSTLKPLYNLEVHPQFIDDTNGDAAPSQGRTGVPSFEPSSLAVGDLVFT